VDDFDDLDALLADAEIEAEELEADETEDDADDDAGDDFDEPLPGQVTLFGADEEFKRGYQIWQGMPEFLQRDLEPQSTVKVHFRNLEDRAAFLDLVGQRVGIGSRYEQSIWYPAIEISRIYDKRYRSIIDDEQQGEAS
jgi:hypothetical protein